MIFLTDSTPGRRFFKAVAPSELAKWTALGWTEANTYDRKRASDLPVLVEYQTSEPFERPPIPEKAP